MKELELTRTPGDRRLYALGSVGTIRFQGLFSRSAAAEANGKRWLFRRYGIFGRRIAALDEAGATVGRFEPREIRRGGAITWDGRRVHARPGNRMARALRAGRR